MSAPRPSRRAATLRAAWNLRAFALFLLGPLVGVALVAAVFGLPLPLLGVAGIMFVFTLALFGILVRGERRRMTGRAAPRV